MASTLRILFFLIFLPLAKVYAQPATTLKLYSTVAQQATDFNVDAQGNIYLITAGGQLKKINAKGDSVAVYNLTKKYGKLTLIDVTNPLKVLLYYKNYNTIIVVDRLLNVINKIDLRKLNIYQASTVASSYDGQIWVYDEQDALLKKINDKGIITQQTLELRQLLNYNPQPQKMIDNDHQLYLYDIQKGVIIFDYYGGLKKQIDLKNWQSFYAYNQNLYGQKKDTLVSYSIGDVQTIQQPIPNNIKPLKMIIAANKIYFLQANQISIYTN